MKAQDLRELVRDIDGLIEAAELGREANDAITEHYQPIETAAERLIEAAGVRADTTHVQIPLEAFRELFRAVKGRDLEEDKQQ